MIGRRRGLARSVVRVAATTAVVAGTAGAVRHHQDQKYAQQDAQQQEAYAVQDQSAEVAQMQQQMAAQQAQIEQMKAQQTAPPPAAAPAPAPAAAPAGGNDLNAQLMQLAQLHTAGVLSDDEFAKAKAKLLGG